MPDQITHTLADIIRFRLLMIAAGYEDGNDASSLRRDPMFKMALDLTPSDRELCSQSTISRLENLPEARALLRMGRAMVDLYCESFQRVPKRITLDIDDTFDAVHGGQQLRLFNAHYDEYGFQPIVVFDGEGRFITAVLRPAKRPGGKEVRAFLRRLLRAIRANWPKTEILLRADSHYCSPEVLDWCRANGLDYILGVAPTTTLRRHIGDLEASTKARFEAAPKEGKARRFKEFFDGAASWSRVERIVARVEAGADGQAIAQPAAPQQPPQGYYGPMPWHMWNGGYGEHGFWMLPLMMLFLLLVCAAFFAIARRSCGHGMHSWGGPANRPWGDSSGDSWGIPWGNPSHSALQILNERFARGEIQKEEYTEKKAALMSGGRA